MKRKYWYKFFVNMCPLCGKEDCWKERVYDKSKPKNPARRYSIKEVWDYCGGL